MLETESDSFTASQECETPDFCISQYPKGHCQPAQGFPSLPPPPAAVDAIFQITSYFISWVEINISGY